MAAKTNWLFPITCLVILLFCLSGRSLAHNGVEFFPPSLDLTDKDTKTFQAVFNFSLTGKVLKVEIEKQNVLHLESVEISEQEANITVSGKFLGYSKVFAEVFDNDTKMFDAEYRVGVARTETVLQTVFQAGIGVVLAINYINMGCQLDLKMVLGVLKKPFGPVIGFCCQFLFMPLASFGIGLWLLKDDTMRLGLFLLGCSPGGNSSNLWTLMFDGDLCLSITMTFFSTIAAIGMMPLWMFLLGKRIMDDTSFFHIPYDNLVTSLVSLIAPLVIGILIRRFRPAWAEKSKKIVKPVSFIILLGIVIINFIINQYIFQLITWYTLVSGVLVAWSGYVFGALVAFMVRLPREQIIAISIETAFQNGALTIVVLLASFRQPDADLSMVPVICQIMLQAFPLYFVYLGIKGPGKIKKCLGKANDSSITEENGDICKDSKENFSYCLDDVKTEQQKY